MNLKDFTVGCNETIKDALTKIELNTCGAVFIIDSKDHVQGIATDGDIRRALLKDISTEEKIRDYVNKEFLFVPENTSRERILKLLDQKISIIPELDHSKKLLNVYTRKSFPIRTEKTILARAKSPVRISFGGGGTDLTDYFTDYGGAVLNSTIAMYSHSNLIKRNDDKIIITSHDLNKTLEFNNLFELKKSDQLSLILSLIDLIDPPYGFELIIESDFPPGSGLGGSAVVLSSIIGCFNKFREDKWNNYEIAELAFQAERIVLDIAGGWQDQYATVFGGFNFMEFDKNNNVVHPLRISKQVIQELEENLVLCFTGKTHDSGNIHVENKKHVKKQNNVESLINQNIKLTYELKNCLLKGKLHKFGTTLDEVWNLKKQYGPGISNSQIENIYNVAKEAGSLGGKILGAGGGGYFLFYVEYDKRAELKKSLRSLDLNCQNINFETEGLQSWTVRLDN